MQAMLQLGLCYEKGRGIGRSAELALAWYKKAAEADCPPACLQMGRLCETGRLGVARNYRDALRWYRKAADAGDKEAADAVRRLEKSGLLGFLLG